MLKYLGFISYSHIDATDLTEDLDKYLTKHSSKFETVYDGQVPEGEKLEKILEKLRLCHILILIITTDSLTSEPIAEEIKIAKEKEMKIIPCKNKFIDKKWEELPWDIRKYKGFEFENKYDLKRISIYALGRILKELEKESEQRLPTLKSKEVLAEYEVQEKIGFLQVSPDLVLQSDKSVYMFNSDMICTIINTNKKSTVPINLVIFNEEKKIVYKDSIPIDPSGTGIYQEVIRIAGEEWSSKPGTEYLAVAEHEGKKAQLSFFITDFGAAVELDQKVYTWTDKVYITIVAPDFNLDSNKIERIGNNEDSKIIISTRCGHLENYELVETNPNTGIFVGEVKLTGFANYDARGDGKMESIMGRTSGKGSTDGLIACGRDDAIKIVLKTKYDEFVGSALIGWNIGEIQWLKPNYKIGDTGMVVIVDPDMNINPDLIEIFSIRIWSDSDPIGTEVVAIETGPATGIFSASIQFGLETTKNQIKVSSGDSVFAVYVDRTLPSPYMQGNSLDITSTTEIV